MKVTALLTLLFFPIALIAADTESTVQSTTDSADNANPTASATADGKIFRVGIKESPPFTLRDEDGSWYGPAVWLMERICEDLGMQPEYIERTIPGIFQGLQDGELDAGLGALSITSDREQIVDFTHAYYEGGIGIATTRKGTEMWVLALRNIFSLHFLKVAFGLLLLLGFVGFILWLVEHRVNREQFAAHPARGLGEGIWWSAVTMTTVGYGDKAPVTTLGRIIGMIWMFTAIIITASFTAGFASSLTRDTIAGQISNPSDMVDMKTATVNGSTSASWLRELRIPFRTSDQIEALMKTLNQGGLEVVVYDKPILEYYKGRYDMDEVQVLPNLFTRENYGIALPLHSPLRNKINVILLRLVESEEWQVEFYRIANTD